MNPLRFLVDADAGLAVAETLRLAGHDVLFVGDLDWHMTDDDILSLAVHEQRIILTLDTDFGELVYRSRRLHAGVLLLRVPGADRREKSRIVQEIVNRYADQLSGHFAVYRQGRLRIRL